MEQSECWKQTADWRNRCRAYEEWQYKFRIFEKRICECGRKSKQKCQSQQG
ncbi:hypothetical protein F230042K4_28660 [Mediterraneibacter glycyrrhizinilyticus]